MVVRWPMLLNPTQLAQIIRQQKNPFTAIKIFNEAKTKYPNYRHNGAVYATMINLLGSSGQFDEMKQVIEQMKDDSCECKDTVFAGIFKTYARAGLLDDAVSLFNRIPQFNCVNWTASFNTLLQIMVNESRLEAFYRLFKENSRGWAVKSRIGSLNLLMDALCQIKRSDLALQVFQEMNYHCCYPDRESYRILMKGLCQDGRLYEATHLLYSMLWRISQKGCGEDIVIYRILLDSLCENKQINEAVEILGKILRKGLRAPKSRSKVTDLSKLRDSEDIEQAKLLINEALIKGAVPSSASYAAVLTDLYAEGKISEANKVFDKMREKGFRPSLRIYESKVAALCIAGRVDEAGQVIDEEMLKKDSVPNSQVYSIVIKGFCDEGKSDLAITFLEKMDRQKGCSPDKETFNVIVDRLCRDGNFVDASKIMEKMLSKSFWPDSNTFSAVIRGLCSIDRIYEAVMWLEEMITQGLCKKMKKRKGVRAFQLRIMKNLVSILPLK
ncbi:pentatricopeptide repeat-containing protein At1g05600 isoform X2 [Spinacia oleracea]|uniref:Pentatricopeptide repeat-containing protein At1g05600 isoform X2 n=1 Tax=Spinacia oleracea TaxID=3562 RepID=A0ABM3R669_SPIOL|nr:pentatricopeptide repeat-containing protein At1g05600 isoform X2 [Spinacia oleracea]XP_056691088.1 pentatricopeptide repeat-containing protein At1g05600 isoform X2 [Spinacia oleracea]XP_056691089.1 pentatricopeptide repeat-containing protein At1g05600 isoform X2 [Spinacia oleracea]XP_056691091.1 pentatricopeptide repeat-containing protein At1g05600 isoform X2 [Spinacia oleracea]XP_056691092.1 pentatricopeptide repeat-containing protein At1g05600 isoform X2 [Spinacia oleracea]